jgi:hypothetical protein
MELCPYQRKRTYLLCGIKDAFYAKKVPIDYENIKKEMHLRLLKSMYYISMRKVWARGRFRFLNLASTEVN